MLLGQELLEPIAGENPSGSDLRYNTELAFYDKIQEARRQDDDLPVDVWEHERKVADYNTVLKLAQDALATTSKDLQVAAWLTDALLHKEGFGGLGQGLRLCHELIARFWDTLYPPIVDGESDLRAKPLSWLGSSLEIPVKSIPLVTSGHSWLKYQESRTVGYEDQPRSDAEKKKRAKLVEEGKLPPEAFDKAFAETPKMFYAQAEKDLDDCLACLRDLDKLCDEKFGDEAPSFSRLKSSLEEVRHTVHALLEKKREIEPDPVEAPPEAAVEGAEGVAAAGAGDGSISVAAGSIVIPPAQAEPADRRDTIAVIAKAAAALRKREPQSPAPYLMMRGLRWGELRAYPTLSEPSLLEAPPTELRQHLKRLAIGNKWSELLEAAENAMSLPCSRAWLDLQHLVIVACAALGPEYGNIAAAIGSEMRNLIADMPPLMRANLLDGTPAANSETRAWLASLMVGPAQSSNGSRPKLAEALPPLPVETSVEVPAEGTGEIAEAAEPVPIFSTPVPPLAAGKSVPPWWEKATNPYTLAREAVKAGNLDKGFAIMREEIARQQSGRGRFQRTLQLIQLCVEAGNDTIAQPLIDDVTLAVETHKLDDWEDRGTVAEALLLIMRTSKKVQGNAGEKQKLFERVCRLDPVRALHAG
jgi:type VI secretion system protein ImpA